MNDNRNECFTAKSDILDLKQIIPLKKILGILQTMQIIISKLAKQMEVFAHQIIKMLCFISKYVMSLLNSYYYNNSANNFNIQDMSVNGFSLNLLKIIRQNVVLRFKEVNSSRFYARPYTYAKFKPLF
jgi:hypothetical protein